MKKINKGIILAGGSGTRLYPLTISISKQLLPVYDKPMIYYPLSVLMLMGINDVLIISTPNDQGAFKNLLGDGSQFGITISYAVQENPEGLAQSYIIGEDFINNQSSVLILGDNIFFGSGLHDKLLLAKEKNQGATIFGYEVSQANQYGVVSFDEQQNVIDIIEKPKQPKSNYAVTGLYIYDGNASYYAKQIKPSKRGELEITSLNNIYLQEKKLNVELLGRGYSWFDTGTHDSLLEAAEFIKAIEKRQNLKIGCPEEIAFHMGYINADQVFNLGSKLLKNNYGKYLQKISQEKPYYQN